MSFEENTLTIAHYLRMLYILIVKYVKFSIHLTKTNVA